MRLLRQIHTKDSATKARISFAAAGVVTGIIALIWISALPARIAERTKLSQEASSQSQKDDMKDVKSAFSDVKTQLGNIASWKDIKKEDAGVPAQTDGVSESNTNEDPVSTETFGESALGAMNLNTASDTPVNAEGSTAPVPRTEISPETNTAISNASTTPTPRVILIGTTTTQKSP